MMKNSQNMTKTITICIAEAFLNISQCVGKEQVYVISPPVLFNMIINSITYSLINTLGGPQGVL